MKENGKPEYGWVKVQIEPEWTAAQIQTAVEKAMADDGDVPIGEIAKLRRRALKVGTVAASLEFVNLYKRMSPVGEVRL